MFGQTSSEDCRRSLAQIWASLAAERRVRIIRLLARLASNLVAAQSEWNVEELDHGTHPGAHNHRTKLP
jgi:DNA-binding transcriptional ArsR family regulator